jgi:hypothetical protein
VNVAKALRFRSNLKAENQLDYSAYQNERP